jgi:hypothetical protein
MKFLILFSALALNACTTAAPTTSLRDLSLGKEPTTGVIVPVRFLTKDTFVGKDGCDVSVREAGGMTLLKEIHFKRGTSIAVAELKPGVYTYREFRCGTEMADLTFENLPSFAVYPGKLSLLGPMVVGLKQQTLYFGVAPLNEKLVATVFSELKSKEAADQVVSGYSGHPLKPAATSAKIP